MSLALAGPADMPALAAIHAAAFPADEATRAGLLDGGCLVLWHLGRAFLMLRVVLDEAEVITPITLLRVST